MNAKSHVESGGMFPPPGSQIVKQKLIPESTIIVVITIILYRYEAYMFKSWPSSARLGCWKNFSRLSLEANTVICVCVRVFTSPTTESDEDNFEIDVNRNGMPAENEDDTDLVKIGWSQYFLSMARDDGL